MLAVIMAEQPGGINGNGEGEKIGVGFGPWSAYITGRGVVLTVILSLIAAALGYLLVKDILDNREEINAIMFQHSVLQQQLDVLKSEEERLLRIVRIEVAAARYRSRLERVICHALVPAKEQKDCEPPEPSPEEIEKQE